MDFLRLEAINVRQLALFSAAARWMDGHRDDDWAPLSDQVRSLLTDEDLTYLTMFVIGLATIAVHLSDPAKFDAAMLELAAHNEEFHADQPPSE